MNDILSVEKLTKTVQGKKHSPELQSIRGIAALVVLIHHSSFYLSYDPSIKYVFECIFNAHAAVVIFFVLSGFVLTISLKKNDMNLSSILYFYIRRGFRIYPALWFAIIIGSLYVFLGERIPFPDNISTWGVGMFHRDGIHIKSFILGLFGFGLPVPIPIWSLSIEIIASIFMPVFVLILTRSKIAFVLISALFAMLSLMNIDSDRLISAYMIDFLFGAAAFVIFEKSESWISDKKFLVIAISMSAFLVMIFFRQAGPWRFLVSYHARIPSLVEALSASVFVGLVHTNAELFPLLRRKVCIWLGDISYSLYVIHLPILGLLALILGSIFHLSIFIESPFIATLLLIALTAVISAIIADFSYKFIEVPAIQLGKKVSYRKDAHAQPVQALEGGIR